MAYRNFDPDFREQLAHDLAAGVKSPYRTDDSEAIRRNPARDMSKRLHRPAFGRDIDKILHLPAYNRYTGKTQVFSFVRNDDISHRGLHVQLVARTARTIARLLGLNEDLTEAIALGHDLGHTPFGHAGEKILDGLYRSHTGRSFNHNVHSVRVLDVLYARNVSLQTLDGVLCHNGEASQRVFRLGDTHDFAAFDETVEACYADDSDFSAGNLGIQNAEIVNNLTVDIVQSSYGKDRIEMSEESFRSLKKAKAENFERIYLTDAQAQVYDDEIAPMFEELYEALRADVVAGNESSPIFRHHIERIERTHRIYEAEGSYRDEDPDQLVTDYLASMTDRYFLAAHAFVCPDSRHSVEFRDYFDGMDYAPSPRG